MKDKMYYQVSFDNVLKMLGRSFKKLQSKGKTSDCRRRAVNISRKNRIKSFVKSFIKLCSNNLTTVEQKAREFRVVQSEVMRGVTKGVLCHRTASRIVSRLYKMFSQKTESIVNSKA